jgi:hypothetical protein
MVRYDVVSLFARVPIEEAMDLLGCHFEDVLALFCHILITSYFTFSGHFYRHRWCGHGLTAFSHHSKLLHGGLHEGGA